MRELGLFIKSNCRTYCWHQVHCTRLTFFHSNSGSQVSWSVRWGGHSLKTNSEFALLSIVAQCLQLGQLSALLSRVSRNQIHQCWAQHVVCLKSNTLEFLPDFVNPRWLETLLDNAAHKGRELGFLPAP